MPHQCTNCGRGFPDGSKEMLSGCPDCGGTKFQFSPGGASRDRGSSTSTAGDDGSTTERRSTTDTATDGSAETATQEFEEWPETARPPAERDDTDESSPRRRESPGDDRSAGNEFEWLSDDEDDAQASARSDVVSPDELPSSTIDDGEEAGAPEEVPPEHGRVVSEPADERPSLDELRDELNDQFESIKIVQPGQYELNLMELYDREEQIVSLQEDGRYVINVPDSWRESDDE